MCEYIIFSESTGLYFYSSWLQANAAMFAIVFIFAVYKLQSLQNGRSDINNEIMMRGTYAIIDETRRMFIDPLTRQDAIDLVQDDYWKNKLIEWRELIIDEENIRNWVKPIFKLLLFSLVANGVMITVSSNLHKLGFYFEAIPIFVVLIFQIILVFRLTFISKRIFYGKSEI